MRSWTLSLTLFLSACCAGPDASPESWEFTSDTQRAEWKRRERAAVPPDALVGLWQGEAPGSSTAYLIELNVDGTYRRGTRVALFPAPDGIARSGYEAGGYLVQDAVLTFHDQTGADRVSSTLPGYNTVYERTYELNEGELRLGEARYLHTDVRVPIHPGPARYRRVER